MKDSKNGQEEMNSLRETLKEKAHLFQEEVKDIWDSAEQKWADYQSKAVEVKKSTEESREEIGAALELLKGEITESYNRISSSLIE